MRDPVPCIECITCPIRAKCYDLCLALEEVLPSTEAGRVDAEDLPALYYGRIMTNLILDHERIFTERQQQAVRLYFREGLLQEEVARNMGITQQAVADHLAAVKARIWRMFEKSREFRELQDMGLLDTA